VTKIKNEHTDKLIERETEDLRENLCFQHNSEAAYHVNTLLYPLKVAKLLKAHPVYKLPPSGG
jgi:hypothetical protein